MAWATSFTCKVVAQLKQKKMTTVKISSRS